VSDSISRNLSQALDEVMVYGTRPLATRQRLSGQKLQALSSTSVADALKYFAGVQIKDYGGLGGLKTINVRSLGAQHVGIYIDGIRVTNAQNGTVDLGKFSLSTMESVELYNANKLDNCQSASEYASGSTVYLRTRRPTRDSMSVSLRQGSFGTYMGKGNVQFTRKGWSGFADVEALSTKGNYPFRYHSQYEDTIGRRQNSDIRYIRVEGALFKKGFSSHLYYYDSERGCPGGIVRRLSDKYVNVGREWDKEFFVQASYHCQLGNHRLKFNTKYTDEQLRYCTDYPENQNTARVDNHYHQQDLYGAACYGWTPWEWLSLNASYDVRVSKLHADLKYFDDVLRTDRKQVFAMQMNKYGLQVAASVLHQHYKDYTSIHIGAADPLDRWTSSYTLGYTLAGVTLRGWYKQIFRAPTLNDLYYTQVGNRNLKPEYTKQWNVGAEYHADTEHWATSLQADAYINKIENRIVCLPLKGTYTWSMMNYGYTFCRGLTATGKAAYRTDDWLFSLLTSLTWQRDLNRTDPNDEAVYNKPICYSPALSYGITGIVGWQQLTFTLSDLHVSERMWSYADPEDILAPYDNIDVKLSYTYPVNRRTDLGLCFEVNDLLDVQYEHIPRYPMPGRNYRVTATLAF
jgi:outer membrane cobalamin receptor